METVSISSSIMSLARTPAEKILLARICQRASLTAGVCSDTNNELAQATAMHLKTVSDLIRRLVEVELVVKTMDKEQANKRNLIPRQYLLRDYPSITDNMAPQSKGYPSITDSSPAPYPSITDGTPSDYKSNAYSSVSAKQQSVVNQVRRCVVTGINISQQIGDENFINRQTIRQLRQTEPELFAELAAQLLPFDDLTQLSADDGDLRMTDRLRRLAKPRGGKAALTAAPVRQPPIVCAEEDSAPTPPGARRFCPITSIDITHQQSRHTFATAWTIEALYKNDRPAFDQLAAQLLPESMRQGGPADQCFSLSGRIRELVKAYR